jgi:hypothetical protein
VALAIERRVVRDGAMRLVFEGMHGSVPRAVSACRNQ